MTIQPFLGFPRRPVAGGNDSFTKLLLHGDGSNGSTTFTDASPSARGNATVGGNAQVSTAQSKFGGASMLFDGSGDYLTFADSADFAFGSGDFTVDFWMRAAASAGTTVGLVCKSGGYGPFGIFQNGLNLSWMLSTNGSSGDIKDFVTFATISANQWYHVAVVRNGTAFNAYLDGVSGNSATSSGTLVANSNTLRIGATDPTFNYFNGYIDELRISKGIARWTANFTPPSSPYS